MRKFHTWGALCIVYCALFISGQQATASPLIWLPINPSFIGGSTFNAQWLMTSATAQNKHREKFAPYTAPTTDLMKDFQNSLNRQLLYRLASRILNEAFGEDSLLPVGETEGHYTVGDFTIDITTDGQMGVTLTDTLTGNKTIIEVPYY